MTAAGLASTGSAPARIQDKKSDDKQGADHKNGKGQGDKDVKAVKDHKDQMSSRVVRKLWAYTTVEADDKAIESYVFRDDGYKIFRVDKLVGTYAITGKGTIVVTITEGKSKGKVDLRHHKLNPPTDGDEWDRAEGSKARMKVTFDKD